MSRFLSVSYFVAPQTTVESELSRLWERLKAISEHLDEVREMSARSAAHVNAFISAEGGGYGSKDEDRTSYRPLYKSPTLLERELAACQRDYKAQRIELARARKLPYWQAIIKLYPMLEAINALEESCNRLIDDVSTTSCYLETLSDPEPVNKNDLQELMKICNEGLSVASQEQSTTGGSSQQTTLYTQFLQTRANIAQQYPQPIFNHLTSA